MNLVLCVPGLLGAGPVAAPAPAFARLLAVAGAGEPLADGIDAALAAAYGVARQQDWPLAPMRAAAAGIDPDTAYWLAADPVTLVAGRDDVRLTGIVADLAAADAAALVATLNAHFAADALTFVAAAPDRWFVRTASAPRLRTRPLAVAIDRPLRALLPEGADAPVWRRWQQEIQMLLHEHPVNVARERAGRAPANGVWFSTGGTLPAQPLANAVRTWADGGVAAALAACAGRAAAPLPATLDPALAAAGPATTHVVALAAATGATPFDVAAFERAFAAPAWRALAGGRIDRFALLADGGGGAVRWSARRPSPARRFALALGRPSIAAPLAAARSEAAWS